MTANWHRILRRVVALPGAPSALARFAWAALVAGGLASPADAGEQAFVTIGTGGVTGIYYPAGGATCGIVNQGRSGHGVRCSVETTFGSIDNLEKIRSGEIDFGYVQADWQHHSYHGSSVFREDGPFSELRSVFSLHREVATVVVRAGSPYTSLSDLADARVDVGGRGSGSAASWRALSERLGWPETHEADRPGLNTSELAEALCSGRIDAYFLLIGHPAALIEETRERCPVRILGMEGEAVGALVADTDYYISAEIPAGFYGLDQPVSSFGVMATFVTSARMPETIVETMVDALLDHFDGFRRLHPALAGLEIEDIAGFAMAAPLHPGALTSFREHGLVPATATASGD